METSIIQELNAEADRIIGNKLLPAKIFSIVICLLIFTYHASFRDKICL